MSINEFSPELLMEVLARLLDIPTKIRLERVNKRFRDCTRNVESWKYNTTLRMALIGSREQLVSFHKHTKVITALDLEKNISSEHFGVLLTFSDKLKVRELTSLVMDCPKCDPVVAGFLGKFASTLEKATIACCGNQDECPMTRTLSALLPLCHKLTELWLGNMKEDNNNVSLLNSFLNMSLHKISFYKFYSPMNGEHLAAVCNSAKDHCLSTINMMNADGDPPLRFHLVEFCQSLDPAAAQGIKILHLWNVDCGWVGLLPTLLAVFPNLADVELVDCVFNKTAGNAVKLAKAVGAFLHASAQHQQPVTLKLRISCGQHQRAFGEKLWDMIDLVDVWRSGTKRTANMQQWTRTLAHGNVTVSIQLR